ncbi:hypothetical protein GYU79_07685 [Lactobacillus mellis]|nr:hypothetical protein [Bombilactobacillus mellis]
MLLSIKPQYAKAILENRKAYEFRKRRCKNSVKKIIFYSTAPQSQVVGEAEIEEIIEGSPHKVWEIAKHAAGITYTQYCAYYQGYSKAIAYKLSSVIVYKEPKLLIDFGVKHVPQSFIYLD